MNSREFRSAVMEELMRLGATDVYHLQEGRGHPRIYFSWQGKEQFYVIPGSPGDARRGLLNAIADIRRILGVRPEKKTAEKKPRRKQSVVQNTEIAPVETIIPDPWEKLRPLAEQMRKEKTVLNLDEITAQIRTMLEPIRERIAVIDKEVSRLDRERQGLLDAITRIEGKPASVRKTRQAGLSDLVTEIISDGQAHNALDVAKKVCALRPGTHVNTVRATLSGLKNKGMLVHDKAAHTYQITKEN